jgi:hypothetical protein
MQTWLDWYANEPAGTIKKLKLPPDRELALFGKPLERVGGYEAFRKLTMAQIRQTVKESNSGNILIDACDPDGNLKFFEFFLWPFIADQELIQFAAADCSLGSELHLPDLPPKKVAIKPSYDLIEALSRAKPPSGQEAF